MQIVLFLGFLRLYFTSSTFLLIAINADRRAGDSRGRRVEACASKTLRD
jgi:hypothetical protein